MEFGLASPLGLIRGENAAVFRMPDAVVAFGCCSSIRSCEYKEVGNDEKDCPFPLK